MSNGWKSYNGTGTPAWTAFSAVWKIINPWLLSLWRCDTTNSGHIGIGEFQELCQEFGIEEVIVIMILDHAQLLLGE